MTSPQRLRQLIETKLKNKGEEKDESNNEYGVEQAKIAESEYVGRDCCRNVAVVASENRLWNASVGLLNESPSYYRMVRLKEPFDSTVTYSVPHLFARRYDMHMHEPLWTNLIRCQ